MPLVENGLSRSGTTAQRPTNAEIGQCYFDETLGIDLVWNGTAWQGSAGVVSVEITFTETAGAGTYTGTVTLPAGATLLNIIVVGVALWDNTGTAVLKAGDTTDDDGYFTAVNLKATDLLAGESIDFNQAGGKAGADIANSQINRRYSSTARAINVVVTTSSTGGSAGRTRAIVQYTVGTTIAATKA